MPMERERDTAIRTVARFAAIAAQQRRRKPASVQKQNRLLPFLETIGDGLRQSLGQMAAFFSFRRSWRRSTTRMSGICF